MPIPTPDIGAALEILAEMTDCDAQWQRELAGYADADGDIDPERYQDYDKAKLDYGWDLVGSLSDWVARLAIALGTQHAP